MANYVLNTSVRPVTLLAYASAALVRPGAHVNFPYPRPSDADLSAAAAAFQRGEIVFTELNHGFINAAATPYRDQIACTFADRGFWTKTGTSADSYENAMSLFLEMMNWALVALYVEDVARSGPRAAGRRARPLHGGQRPRLHEIRPVQGRASPVVPGQDPGSLRREPVSADPGVVRGLPACPDEPAMTLACPTWRSCMRRTESFAEDNGGLGGADQDA